MEKSSFSDIGLPACDAFLMDTDAFCEIVTFFANDDFFL
jgi:hypothetical protein